MSAGVEGTENLDKEGETPTASVSEGIPNNCNDELDGLNFKDKTLAPEAKADSLEDASKLEALIDKKLPSDKEKGLDVDSELDFELKWDDDVDNDNQGVGDIDLVSAGKELEDDPIEKNSKEADSAFTSTEHLDSLDKTDSFMSTENDLDSLDKEETSTTDNLEQQNLKEADSAFPSTEQLSLEKTDSCMSTEENLDSLDKEETFTTDNIDNETKGILSTIDEHLDITGKEIQVITDDKAIENSENNIDDTNSNNKIDMINSMDVGDSKESQLEEIDNESKKSSEHLLPTKVASEDKTLYVDTNVRIDTERTSPVDSEVDSLDEHLVYSDEHLVYSDDIDKDLMDEIDATDISNEKLHTEKPVTSDLLPDTVNKDDAEKLSSDVITSHNKDGPTEKQESEMDVDIDLVNSQATQKLSNETISSSTDMDTSTYDVNNEHGLDKPDVMIDIPTQELIDKFDDADDTFNNTDDNLDNQSVNNIIDSLDTETIKDDAENLTESKIVKDTVKSKAISHEMNDDKLLADEVETSDNDKVDNTPQIENMEVDSSDSVNELEADATNTAQVEDYNISNLESNDTVENITTLKEKVTHADIILVAKSELPNAQEDSTTTEESKKIEVKDVKSSNNLELQEAILEAKKTEIKQTEAIEESSKQKEATEGSSKQTEAIEENSKQTEAKEESSIEKPVANAEVKGAELKVDTPVTKTVDEAQPSTSKYHQESSDEDQEATDSLGLLAESSRVMDDDDEQEPEPEAEEDDDDDDFDQDDESNQMTAEHSEDSNAQHSEAEVPKDSMEVDSNDTHESNVNAETDMDSHDALPGTVALPDETEAPDLPDEVEADDGLPDEPDQSDDLHDDDSSDEKDDLDIQIGEVISHNVETAVAPESVEATEEAQRAVDALLEGEIPDKSVDETVAAAKIEEKVELTLPDSDKGSSKLRKLLLRDNEDTVTPEAKKSPSKTKKLEISKPKNEINIVELEESSSEDDIQVINKSLEAGSPKDGTSVTIPSGVEVMAAAAGQTSDIQEKNGEVRVSGLPKPQPQKPTRLNTDEISIKTASATEPLIIPETTQIQKTSEPKTPIDFGLEIFSLDSDDEETEVRSKRKSKLTAVELDKARQTNKCINVNCTSDGSVPLVPPSLSAAVYYAANQQRGGGLCLYCAKRFEERSEKLVEGVKDLTPFLNMDMCMIREEFVEISDSDSEDEPDIVKGDDEIIGEKGAKFLEEHLAAMFNETWKKFDMEERLLSAQAEINVEVGQLEEECKEIDAMLNECQKETDKLRNDLYATFADDRTELPPVTIVDTPTNQWSGPEQAASTPPPPPEVKERPKRRSTASTEPPAKRAAIPLGYEPIDKESTSKQAEPKPTPSADLASQNDDDNNDISVVKLSVEAAPAGLPPPGVASRPPLRAHMPVFAMRNTFGAWHRVRIQEVQPKAAGQFTMCRVRFEQPKPITKLLPARCLAYEQAPDVRLTIGTRVVALFKDHRVNADNKEEGEKKEAYYSGIVAEIPNPVNKFRYLIFFDDGYAQYVQHANTRLVCECAPRVWDEVHPFSRNFVRDYLRAYPERPMVRLHAGQSIKTEWDGKWWVSKVLQVDASLVLVYFEGKKDNKTEWIYRGSTRLAPLYLELQAAERTRARPLPRAQAARRFNMPYVEYTRSDETEKSPHMAPAASPAQSPAQIQASMEQEIRRQRAVAKKSTALPPAPPSPAPAAAAAAARDNVTSRVVFYTPKNAIKPHKMVPHTCGPKCKRTDVLALKDLRTYNPLTKPLLSGWERQTVRYRIPAVKAVMYRAPCGRRIRNYEELHKYLQAIDSDMGVDLFDFNPATHCLAEFLLNKCLISKKDLSHGKENVPVPCVNYYDSSLPEFCSYNTERTPTAGVPLNLDPEFLCGCDCTDDCADKTKCACWKMTLEGARTIGLDTNDVGYVYKRLPEPLPSGIYECNSRCKCKQTCLNRVAQHPLQLKLQVFKTANRGWGIRALNDVPKGAFLCVYAGNLLTDATANLDGLNEGDEYLAELDYIEVVEQMKEGFEEDIPEDAKKLDEEEGESSSMSSSDEEPEKRDADDDFRPALPTGQYTPSEYSKRLRKREKSKKEKEDKKKQKEGEDCITISDDEELREPAHFSAQAGMGGKEFVSKYKSVRTLFGRDEACYIMDAKVQGNIGRYLNHSCTPNVFVQNVFVDTHDPRFPWVAFFALSQIRAGTELTWNYNYDVGSVPGKVLYCYCNAPNCRGRLL